MSKLRRQIWQWQAVLVTGSSVAILIITASFAGFFQFLEWATYDQFTRLRPPEPIDDRITLITVSEADIREVGQWPVSDQVLTKFLTNLKQHEPRVIGLGIYRDLSVPPGNEELAALFRSTPNLIGVHKVVGNDTVAPPVVLAELNQVGIVDMILDSDGKVRRGLLSVKLQDNQTSLSLATLTALAYLAEEGITLEVLDEFRQEYRLGSATFVPFYRNDGVYVRASDGGYQILLNYRGVEFDSLSMSDVLANRIPPELIRDRVVLVGATAESIRDFFQTPYSNHLIGSTEPTPGVIIHANLVSQLLSSALDNRPLIRVWSDQIEWLWVLLWSFVGAGGRWLLLQASVQKKIPSPWATLGVFSLLIGGGLVVGSYLIFLESWWVSVIAPLTALVLSDILITGYHNRQLQQKSEQDLRASERKLAQFLEAMPIGIVVLEINGKISYANQVAQQLLGEGVNLAAQVESLADIAKIYVAGTKKLYPTTEFPIVRALAGEAGIADDLEVTHSQGVIPLETRSTPIYSESGEIIYAIATFEDITERKQAELERERFTQKLFELNQELENALDAEVDLTDAYGRFVPHQFLSFLGYESITEVKLGEAVELEMSILFSDIRDFTTLSEQMTPAENFKFINRYLSQMESSIVENDGFVDKYIGDAIMALFAGGADQALNAAISMLKTLENYNQQGTDLPIKIGIGINTGSLMLGIVGGQHRVDSTVISDAVNLASRIEQLTKNYDVSLLMSHHTFFKLNNPENYHIRLVDKVKVKGKSEWVTIYEVFDSDPPTQRAQKLVIKPRFEEGVLLFQKNDFAKSQQCFQDCLQQVPQDRISQIYLERCAQKMSE